MYIRKYFAAFDWLILKMSVDTSQNLTLRPLFKDPGVDLTAYRDQHFKGSRMQQEKLLKMSCTLYVGNLSYYTTEEQIYELFSKCGDLKRVVMGLDKFKKTPCGFCFVEYCERLCAENAVRYINGTRLDDRVVRTDWDAGFKEGRQFGRGKAGGQVRDEYRMDFDPGRGGFGARAQLKGEKQLTRTGNAIERETPKPENEET